MKSKIAHKVLHNRIIAGRDGKPLMGMSIYNVKAVPSAHYNWVGIVDTLTVVSSDKKVWVMLRQQFND